MGDEIKNQNVAFSESAGRCGYYLAVGRDRRGSSALVTGEAIRRRACDWSLGLLEQIFRLAFSSRDFQGVTECDLVLKLIVASQTRMELQIHGRDEG